MPNPNAIISYRIQVEAERGAQDRESLHPGEGLTVELDGGRRVRLDPADPRSAGFAQILDGLAKLGRPVYLETDPETGAVTRLLIPHVARVRAVRPVERGYDVEIEISQARHLLDREQPDFELIERQLREALGGERPVILTEDDEHRIIDVRPAEPGPLDRPLGPFDDLGSPPLRLDKWSWIKFWLWPIWPWRWWYGCISPGRAQQVFDAMSATTCNPLTVPAPCIPFLYPDDGCWGRAHEMCRLMINMGLSPRKVWIQGSLHTPTRNNPFCFVNWGWHVAPTLCVWRWRWFWFLTSRMVIDPSLFATPVTEAGWKAVQGDPNASLTPSSAAIFYLWGNQTDPTYAQTNQVLATYRLQLHNRSLNAGPPPYANCP